MAQASERAVDERAIELLWRSADGQGEIPMGTYRTEQEALAAISGARAELLAQCPDDDDQTDHIHAGRWVVVLPEDERDERRADERYPDLRCPHCAVWIGDLDDPDIATVSVKHDLDECCYATAEEN